MLERLLLLWLTLLSLLAYFWADMFPGVGNPFLASKPYLNYMILTTMFAIGSLLPRDEVRQVATRWPTVLGGTAVQYASMPLLAFCVGRLFGFEGPMLIGITMVGCVPGAMASNVLTLAARANVSYSVSLTTMATLLSPLMVPAVLMLTLGQWRAFPPEKLWHMSLTLCWTVVLPVVAGHMLSRTFGRWESIARRVGPIVANLSILWIIAVVVALNRDRLADFQWAIIAALLLINLGGYLAGNLGGRLLRLPRPMRRALTLEVGMQNAGLGTVLALEVFKEEPTAAIPTALYTFGCMFTGTILARTWGELTAREEATQDTPKSKRRWYQFSLRSLFVLTTFVAIACSWYASEMHKAAKRRAAIEEIERIGGVVYYYDPADPNSLGRPPAWFSWMRKLHGDKQLGNVVSVNLIWQKMTDERMVCLESLTGTRSLCLLATEIRGEGLKHLKYLKGLKELDLSHTEIGDAGLVHLRESTSLEMLYLNDTRISDAGLENLKGLTDVETLDIGDTELTGSGLVHLRGLQKLEILNLNGTKVTAAELVHVRELPNLGMLCVATPTITDAGLDNLKDMTNLQVLILADSRITDAGLLHLRDLTNLVDLNLNRTRVSVEAVENLQKALPDTHIRNAPPPIIAH